MRRVCFHPGLVFNSASGDGRMISLLMFIEIIIEELQINRWKFCVTSPTL